jgi:hypothetical protein
MENTPDDKKTKMMKSLGIIPVNQETEEVENNSTEIATSVPKKEDSVANGYNNALNFKKRTAKPTNPTPEEVQAPNPPAEVKTPSEPKEVKKPEAPVTKELSELFEKLSSLFSPKKEIDFENMDFTLDIFPENEGKGTTISYKLKDHEADSFEDLKHLLPTTQNSDTFKWIILTILNDYDTLIQEEIEWKQEIKNMTPAELKTYVETEKDDIRQIRLERMGLFTAPQGTRGKDIKLNITCQLGAPAMKKLNQLLSLLGEHKRPFAIRWIMNAFIDDYGNFIHEKAEDKRLTDSLLGI